MRELLRRGRLLEAALCGLALWNAAMVLHSFDVDWSWGIEDDVRQSMYYFASVQDAELFRGDPFLAHARAFQPPGFALLVAALCRFVDIVIAAKLVGLISTVLTLALIPWAAASYFPRRSLGFWLAIVFLSANAYLWFLALTGMSRGYAAPLSLFALIAFRSPRHRLYVAAVVLAALFSPTILLFLAALAPGRLWEASAEDGPLAARLRKALPAIAVVALTFALAGGLSWLWQGETRAALGSPADYQAWKDDPAFGPDGRWVHERIRGLGSELRDLSALALPLPARVRALSLLALVGLCGLAVLRRQAAAPGQAALRAAFWFFVAGLLTSQLASAIAFKIYHPNRYWIPVCIALILALTGAIAWLWDAVQRRWPSGSLRPAARFALLAAGVLGLAVMLREGGYRPASARKIVTVRVAPPEQELLRFVRERLPKAARLAGNPFLMDNVPLFAKRSVWSNYELLLPLYPRHYERLVARTDALIPAYFSWSEDALRTFACGSDVTHLVVDRADFRDGAIPWSSPHNDRGPSALFIAPFRERIRARLAARPAGVPWLLPELPTERVVFGNAAYRVIDLRPWRQCGAAGPRLAPGA